MAAANAISCRLLFLLPYWLGGKLGVFERFRQDEQSQNHESLGVGLSIVRHIVDLHGGSIEAESAEKDQGATFTVHLPLASEELRNMFPATPSGSRNLRITKATNLAVSANANG